MNMTYARARVIRDKDTGEIIGRQMRWAPKTLPPAKRKKANRARRHRLNPGRRSVADHKAATIPPTAAETVSVRAARRARLAALKASTDPKWLRGQLRGERRGA